MAICVIGNSHIASLKHASEKPAFAAVRDQLVFFGAAGMGLNRLRVAGGVLKAKDEIADLMAMTSGGLREIGGHYDHYVLKGMFFGLYELGELFTNDLLRKGGSRGLNYSPRFLEAIAFDLLDNSLAIQVADRVRAISKAPITIVPAPFPSEQAIQGRQRVWRKAPLVAQLRKAYERAAAKVVDAHQLQLIEQPPETILEPGFTRKEFSVGSIRLSQAEHREADIRHMNAEYGALILARLPL